MSDPLVGVETRLTQLTGEDADLLGYFKADATEDGVYYVTLRAWPHPSADDATTLSMRYAYLTRGQGSDGWVGGDSDAAGVNFRVEGDPGVFLQTLAQMCAGSIPRLDADTDPWTGDATGEQ